MLPSSAKLCQPQNEKTGTAEGVRPTELTHTRLGGVSSSIWVDIENSRSRAHR